MAIKFDASLQYQFVLFYDFTDVEEPAELTALPEIISRQIPGTKSLGLKLARKERQQSLLIAKQGMPPLPSSEWVVGAGIWRLTWNPVRMDLYFDAVGFSEISEETKPTLKMAVDRVVPNLIEVARLGSFPRINRLALATTGKASDSEARGSTPVIAKLFFNEGVSEGIAAGEVRDLTARVNLTSKWNIPIMKRGDASIRVNRINQATTNWQYEAGVERATLTWLFDVNTGPSPDVAFGPDSIAPFFGQAEAWVSQKLAELGT